MPNKFAPKDKNIRSFFLVFHKAFPKKREKDIQSKKCQNLTRKTQKQPSANRQPK